MIILYFHLPYFQMVLVWYIALCHTPFKRCLVPFYSEWYLPYPVSFDSTCRTYANNVVQFISWHRLTFFTKIVFSHRCYDRLCPRTQLTTRQHLVGPITADFGQAYMKYPTRTYWIGYGFRVSKYCYVKPMSIASRWPCVYRTYSTIKVW